ncbi:MAG: small basic protein [Planctomycetota bacterium]|jgi:small basic protein (TIGR04137 family)|nr:small basic protein [Planctomycetota bacterium]MDP6519865.1 small basic protein [Planctomycetota bacterium]MDP6838130.1 small basic protein [Planctomycetota bacterium]
MSIHPSLRGADGLVGQRSVLTRIERIQKLQKDGRFDGEQDSVYGLPKVRTQFKVKKKKKDEDEATEGEAAATEGDAAAEA